MGIDAAPDVNAGASPPAQGRGKLAQFASGGAVGAACVALGGLLLKLDIPQIVQTEPLVAVGLVLIIFWGVLACVAALQLRSAPSVFVTLCLLLLGCALVSAGVAMTTPVYVTAQGSSDLQEAGMKITLNGRPIDWADSGAKPPGDARFTARWEDRLLLDVSGIQGFIDLQRTCLTYTDVALSEPKCAKLAGPAKPRS